MQKIQNIIWVLLQKMKSYRINFQTGRTSKYCRKARRFGHTHVAMINLQQWFPDCRSAEVIDENVKRNPKDSK